MIGVAVRAFVDRFTGSNYPYQGGCRVVNKRELYHDGASATYVDRVISAGSSTDTLRGVGWQDEWAVTLTACAERTLSTASADPREHKGLAWSRRAPTAP